MEYTDNILTTLFSFPSIRYRVKGLTRLSRYVVEVAAYQDSGLLFETYVSLLTGENDGGEERSEGWKGRGIDEGESWVILGG